MTLDEVISALEAATRPSRELDVEIALYLDPSASPEPDRPAGTYGVGRGASRQAPRYTASIDVALTLVPDGWWWQVDSEGACGVGPPSARTDDPAVEGIDPVVAFGRMLPPAIALCIVALTAYRGEAGR